MRAAESDGGRYIHGAVCVCVYIYIIHDEWRRVAVAFY